MGRAVVSGFAAGEGPLVVLLHGIPTGADLWCELAPRLADTGLRAVAFDLPGYGATRVAPSSDHSLAAAADLVADWIGRSGGPAWVVGHDAGGAVAQLVAVRHPERVRRMTLTQSIVEGTFPAPRARLGSAAARAGLVRAAVRLRLFPNPFARWFVHRAVADRALVPVVDRLVWDEKFSDPTKVAAFERHLADLSPRDTEAAARGLPATRVPCQLVWGTADPYQPWETSGSRLGGLLPHAAVTLLEGCGHFTPVECPDRLADAMLTWTAEAGA